MYFQTAARLSNTDLTTEDLTFREIYEKYFQNPKQLPVPAPDPQLAPVVRKAFDKKYKHRDYFMVGYYEPHTRDKNVNSFRYAPIMVFDIDDHDCAQAIIEKRIDLSDIQCFYHHSLNSTTANPQIHIIIDISPNTLSLDEYKTLEQWTIDRYKLTVCKSARGAKRLYFLPSIYAKTVEQEHTHV